MLLKIIKRIRNLIKKYIEYNTYNPLRKKYELILKELVDGSKEKFDGPVVIDASWDNPNYWYRCSLIRSALGLNNGYEIGLIGPHRRKYQKGSLKRFKINKIFDYHKIRLRKNHKLAVSFFYSLKSLEDIFNYKLPYDAPLDLLYDQILKKQKRPFIDITDKNIIKYTEDFLNCFYAAELLIEKYNPKIFILSHAIGLYFTFAWVALKKNIRVIILFGNHGVLRFWNILGTDGIYNFQDRPAFKDYKSLSEKRKKKFKEVGMAYLNKRFYGKTGDIGSKYAYKMRNMDVDKDKICKQYSWDKRKKIICLFASNWFDFPHCYGMKNFKDFYDWIFSTMQIVKECKDVNWLFKAHPCDDWYGGYTLKDFFNFNEYPHIKLVLKEWDSNKLIDAIDGIITYHGTIGIEATCKGKPVLVPDNGWYHDWNFVKVSKSRDDYLRLLKSDWYNNMDIKKNTELAKVFAGMYWGVVKWQENFLLSDDSTQWELYRSMPGFIYNNMEKIKKEINLISEWYKVNVSHYNTYKIMKSDEFIV